MSNDFLGTAFLVAQLESIDFCAKTAIEAVKAGNYALAQERLRDAHVLVVLARNTLNKLQQGCPVAT